jgi:photosystem II stability/assembly factor-like uncharacterized protein
MLARLGRSVVKEFRRIRSGVCLMLALLSCDPIHAQQFDPRLFSGMRWRSIGPFRGGRTVAITGVSGRPNIFYMAAVNGGVWKTSDYGQVWTPLFDSQPTGSVGAIAVAPSNPNIVYVGSGEGLQRPDLSVGDGIYKSTDGGQTWQHFGLRDGQQIATILVDPRDPNRVFVAVLGHPFGPNGERGVFRSTDGGRTWAKVLYRDENTGAADLGFDPSNPKTIYAALWAARKPPWEIRAGGSFEGPGSGLFKSTDGGNTWRQLTRGLPTTAEGLGRIGLGVAPNRPKRIYALVSSEKLGGLYRSDDAGESWERVNEERRVTGRGPGAMGVAVAPDNPDVVYVANTSTYRSTDGGHTFTAIKGAPGGDDYQRIWINPENPVIIALSSDQGAIISVNGGETWSSWYNQPTAQFYHVITDHRFPYWVYGAQQESGSAGTASRSDYGEITFREWHSVGVEEYGYIAPNPLDPNILYGGKITRTNQATGEVQDISPEPVHSGKYRYVRTEPVVISPFDPHTLYFASSVLFKTTNGGRSWEIASPDLTRANYEVPASLGIFAAADPEKGKHRGVIYSVAPSFKDPSLIWVGTDDGLIHLTRDGAKTWHNVTPPELTPWSKVSALEASHFDPAVAYAAINRFRLDDLHPYIYRTRDGGKTWRKTTNGLPDNAPVNVIREDLARKGLLFAGTESSVYVSLNDGDDWQPLQLNLPHTSMRDLAIHEDDLVVATHGRSFWILDDITPLRQLTAEVAKAEVYLYRPQAAYRVRWNRNTDTPLPPEVPAGKNPPDGAILDYYLASAATGPVTLEIFDFRGKPVRRFSSTDQPAPIEKDLNVPTYWVRPPQILSAEVGMHRFVWDLHYPAPDSLAHEYPIAAIYRDTPRYPRGPAVLAGRYMVKLTVGGRSYKQPLVVKMDPRVKTPPAGLAQQSVLESGISKGMNEDFVALKQVQSLRAQLKDRKARAGQPETAEAISALDKKAEALEGKPETSVFGLAPRGTEAETLSRLNLELGHLLGVVDSADAAPTTQAVAAYGELEHALRQLLAYWKELGSHDVAALNEQLKKVNLPPITVLPTPGAVGP